MKIFIISASLGDGGSQRVMVNYANYFVKKKDSNVFFISLGIKNHYENELDKNVEVVKFRRIKSSLAFFDLFKIIKRERPDKIISSQTHINILTILVSKLILFNKKNIFLREANTIIHSDNSFIKKKFKILLIKFLYKNYNIICSSEGLKNEVQNINKKIKIHTIYISINKSEIVKLSEIEDSQISFFSKTKFILFFGRMKKHKGVLDLIQAYKKANLKNIKLIFMGEGAYRKQVIDYANEYNLNKNIYFLDFKKNPYPFIKAAVFCVLPSYFEGIPNTILQSLVLNKNIICYDCNYGPSEILGKYSKLLVKVGDINSLALKLNYFSKHNQAYFKESVLEKFDTSKNLGKLYDIIIK